MTEMTTNLANLENLELKAYRRSQNGQALLDLSYADTLNQTDTYYNTSDGRLKLREEVSKDNQKAYFIRYDRTDEAVERKSVYDFYPVSDVALFKKVFGGALTEEIVVKKERKLYLYKNARIHLDTVAGLGKFIEIEVVIRTKDEDIHAPQLMNQLIEILNIKPEDKLSLGYRELLMKQNATNTKKIAEYNHNYSQYL